jgi:hypothetical protein
MNPGYTDAGVINDDDGCAGNADNDDDSVEHGGGCGAGGRGGNLLPKAGANSHLLAHRDLQHQARGTRDVVATRLANFLNDQNPG